VKSRQEGTIKKKRQEPRIKKQDKKKVFVVCGLLLKMERGTLGKGDLESWEK